MKETLHFINGESVPSKNGETFNLFNPATEELFTTVSRAGDEEIEAAVESAEKAFHQWKRVAAAEKAAVLNKYARLIEENAGLFAKYEAQSMGIPVSAHLPHCRGAIEAILHNAALARVNVGISSLNTPNHINLTMKQPFGVVAAILPWNAPLPMFANKVGPAVAAGNAIIVKTSEKAPVTSALAAELAIKAGFPKGLINVIHGEGATGAKICAHPKIRKISFTGSVPTGKRVAAAALVNLKNTTLELGGKSPAIVFDDADLEIATDALAASIVRNSGQICAAQTRVYVHNAVKDKFIALYQKKWEAAVHFGDTLDPKTNQGPMADRLHYETVTRWIETGKKEGKVAFGGTRVGDKGYFIAPTLFTDVPHKGSINVEELFGPVVVLHSFDEEDEVLRLANDSEFGLSSSVFTTNINRAMRVAEKLEAGNVSVNTHNTVAYDMPFGGVKQSGIGREVGCTALEAYLEVKSVFIKIAPN